MGILRLKPLFISLFLLSCLNHSAFGQSMLTYTDAQGDFYVNDGGRLVHLEHLRVRSAQTAANSVAYISNVGELVYYANHEIKRLDISNPTFYKNTDHYLYYSNGGSFSVFDGKERKYLGYIQQNPYAFGDSLAAVHDYAEFFYVYDDNQFIELERQPVLKAIAGDNILAYVNHIGQFRVYFHGQQIDIDSYAPIQAQAGANTVAYIDNYNFLKVFWGSEIYELVNLPTINCLSSTGNNNALLESWCNGPVVVDVQTEMPVFQTGDGIVAYIDDVGDFYVFSEGIIVSLEDQIPQQYQVVDNLLWYIDANGFLKVFCNGELSLVETYAPSRIKADLNVIAYTDLDNRLKVFYNNTTQTISDNIILDFELNNTMVMYNEIANKYKFHILE